MRRLPLLAIVVALAFATFVTIGVVTRSPEPDADPVSPPHRWGAFSPGAWILVHEIFRQGSQQVDSDERTDLVERAPDFVTLREEVGPPARVTTRREGLRDEPETVEGAELLGRETITLFGTEFRCAAFRRIAGAVDHRFWLAPGIAWPVKSIATERDERRETRRTHGSEFVILRDRTVKCCVFEELRLRGNDVVHRATSWRSLDVPGHEVLREEQFSVRGAPVTLSRRVAAFGR